MENLLTLTSHEINSSCEWLIVGKSIIQRNIAIPTLCDRSVYFRKLNWNDILENTFLPSILPFSLLFAAPSLFAAQNILYSRQGYVL